MPPSVVKVKTKGVLDAATGTSTSRELMIEIEGIESMKQEREILASPASLSLAVEWTEDD